MVDSPKEITERLRKYTRTSLIGPLKYQTLFSSWADVSGINYYRSGFDIRKSMHTLLSRSMMVPPLQGSDSVENYFAQIFNKIDKYALGENFPVNVTTLMNEEQLWRAFYPFPELYLDEFSPTIHVRSLREIPGIENGILRKDTVTVCLSYLARTPILGDFVYIKLDISSMHIRNIDVLQQFKYLVYLDVSGNYLTELSVMSYLLYIQFLSVAYNRLETVLDYDTPQWFLTEVQYMYNSVTQIRDLNLFWSLTILDLSHNNIKQISGLETLHYLRRLDLSFNHIQMLENLNNLRLTWLDISYNNISSFDFGPESGLWTLLHLEYLNVNENKLRTMKLFSGCTRLRELRARNNRLSTLLEIAIYTRQLCRLVCLDLRANPVCEMPGYRDVVINTFRNLLNLDEEPLNPVEQRQSYMVMSPDIHTFTIRRLHRMMYVEQLSRAKVSSYVPPADTTDVPLIIIVGYEAVGKGTLARRLAEECSAHVELALLHTTACHHGPAEYITIPRSKFDDMLLAGEFLTYSDANGDSYGLSREQAFVKDGRVRIASMDLLGALLLVYRGLRPYLILANYINKKELSMKQFQRNLARNKTNEYLMPETMHHDHSTLQVLLSGRIVITGILNEILVALPDVREYSDFILASKCSLLQNSEVRKATQDYVTGMKLLNVLESESMLSLEELSKRMESSQKDTSLYSLFKQTQDEDCNASDVGGVPHNSLQQSKNITVDKTKTPTVDPKSFKQESNLSNAKSVDFSRYTSSTWKGLSGLQETKSSKSVTFNSQDIVNITETTEDIRNEPLQSVSAKFTSTVQHKVTRTSSGGTINDDLWLSFLKETGLLQDSTAHPDYSKTCNMAQSETHLNDHNEMMDQMDFYRKISSQQIISSRIRDHYENIHCMWPGLFFDTVTMDNPEAAFIKMKKIVWNIYNSQKLLKPMFDLDFSNIEDYPNYNERLENIRNKIAPHNLFM